MGWIRTYMGYDMGVAGEMPFPAECAVGRLHAWVCKEASVRLQI